jgi:hypothetical protein
MYEPLVSPSEPSAWPATSRRDRGVAGDQVCGCSAAFADVISVIGDARRLLLISGGLLAGDLIGTASVVSALVGRGHAPALVSLCLLLPVVLSWLLTAAVMLLAERPVAGALGELRRATGAAVDLSAPWAPLGVRPLADPELDWSHVVPLIGATNCQHTRARLALSASVLTTAAFFLWMPIALATMLT